MINIPYKVAHPLSKDTLGSLNRKTSKPFNRESIKSLNNSQSRNSVEQWAQTRTMNSTDSSQQQNNQNLQDILIPSFGHLLQKGQKTMLSVQGQKVARIKVCFGWNIIDTRCDIDASAFLVTDMGKVPSDDWFVFYGQTSSPDNSVCFFYDMSQKNREIINVDFGKLNSMIKKIVFVLTINEAFECNLNFSMIKDAYVRLIDAGTNQEIVSYKLEEYYSNVTSMTIGELYLHNGQWKFNPVGNGVYQDLAGQCAIYGVEIG